MKKPPILTFLIAMTAAVVCVAAYAIREDPAPTQAPAPSSLASLTAQPASASPCESALAPSSAGSKDQVLLRAAQSEPQQLSAHGASAFQPGTASTAFQPSSTGIPRTQPAAAPANFQRASTALSAVTEAPHPPPGVSVPLAFRPIPPEVAGSNPQLAATVQALQQNFVNAVGGQNQDPNDPAYLQRWTVAQRNIDEQYRIQIGYPAFLLYEIKGNTQQ